MRRTGYILIVLICFIYWILDSVWSYLSFEYNLKNLIFSEPVSWLDPFLLRVSPYQMVSRLMVVVLFAVLGSIILEFFLKRQRAEKERKSVHDSLLTILNSIDATIYVADLETHTILFMNRNMIDSFGDDFTGKKCHSAFRNHRAPCPHCSNEQLLDESGNPSGVITWEGQNPITRRWYLNHDRVIQWLDGRLVHLQIASDITELKKLQKEQLVTEARLQQAQKMESIGNLAGGIAHDFNNLLFPIMGMSELLMEDLPKDTVEHENVREILKAALRGRDLVNQILAFSRQNEKEKIPVRIQQILKEVLKLSRSTIPANIDIIGDIQSDCGLVMADPTKVHQIAMNLITNGYHAVENTGGEIRVELSERRLSNDDPDAPHSLEPGRYAVLTVSDNGSGIDPGIIGKIFEPYFTTKVKGKGTGLGLAVVFGIVKGFGGDIHVSSEAGQGTTFRVFLPLMENSRASEIIETTDVLRGGNEHILLVDDEPAIVRYEKEMLERLGYQVTARLNSVEALAAFSNHPQTFDLVITDMTMPNMTGDQLAKAMMKLRPDIPIIICTGFSERINQEKARLAGVKGFLMKPIVKSDIARMVRNVIDADG